MALTINDTTMTSDQSFHTARQAPGHRHGWEVSWLPGQVLDRDTAITAMILADIAATGDIHPDHRLWPAVQSWSAEVGLTGPDALTVAAEFLPEAVLLDIGLPGMDGFEVARQLRQISGLAKVFLIAMTGYASEDDRADFPVAGNGFEGSA